MMDTILSFLLRFWDRLRGVQAEKLEYVEPDVETARKDPKVQKFLKDHKLDLKHEERTCLCGCGTIMRVAPGQTQYVIRAHRATFRRRARERDLLKFRFAANRPTEV